MQATSHRVALTSHRTRVLSWGAVAQLAASYVVGLYISYRTVTALGF
jgi:hypothetical protein